MICNIVVYEDYILSLIECIKELDLNVIDMYFGIRRIF